MSQKTEKELTQEERCSTWAAGVGLFGEDIAKLADKIVLTPDEKADMKNMIRLLKVGVRKVEEECTPIIERP